VLGENEVYRKGNGTGARAQTYPFNIKTFKEAWDKLIRQLPLNNNSTSLVEDGSERKVLMHVQTNIGAHNMA